MNIPNERLRVVRSIDRAKLELGMISAEGEKDPKNITVPYVRRSRESKSTVSFDGGFKIRNSRGLVYGDNVIH